MNTFGCVWYAYVQNKSKFDARSEKGIFIGYDKNSPAYLIYFPNNDDVRRVRCVKFSKHLYEPVYDAEDITIRGRNSEQGERVILQEPVNDIAPLHPTGEGNQREEQRNRYPRRDHKLPEHLNDYRIELYDIDSAVYLCYAMCLDEDQKPSMRP